MTIIATAQVTAVRDPEMRFTPSGKGVCSVRVVSNKRKKDNNGQWVDGEPSYFDVEAWDKLGEQIAENVSKGQRLIVSGRMTAETWEDKEGNKRVAVKLAADNVALDIRFTSYDKREGGGGGGQPAAASSYGQPTDESPF